MPRRIVFSLTVIHWVSGCIAEHKGYLVRTDTEQKSTIVLRSDLTGQSGKVETTMANGKHCQGNFNASGGEQGSGGIPLELMDPQLGIAIFQCEDGQVVTCNFSIPKKGVGVGNCTDSLGQTYRLVLN